MIDKDLFINSTYTSPSDSSIFFFVMFIIVITFYIESLLVQYLMLLIVIYFFMNSKNSIFYSNIIFFTIHWCEFNYISWTKYYMLFTVLLSCFLIIIDKLYEDNDIFFVGQTIINLIFISVNLYIICFHKEGIKQGKESIVSVLAEGLSMLEDDDKEVNEDMCNKFLKKMFTDSLKKEFHHNSKNEKEYHSSNLNFNLLY